MADKKKSHIFIGNNSVRCFNCGTEQMFAEAEGGGFDINVMVGTMKGFEKGHKKCKPSERGKARFEYKTPDEWAKSWDTGTSSMTIYFVMTKKGSMPPRDMLGPRDPSDFGRCYRLLALVTPERRREVLAEVAYCLPRWKPLVDAWDELAALYEEEIKSPDGKAPRLYARMKELDA